MNDDTGEPETHLGRPDESKDPAAPLDDHLGAAATEPGPGPGEASGSATGAAEDAGTSGEPVDHTSELTPAEAPPAYPRPPGIPRRRAIPR